MQSKDLKNKEYTHFSHKKCEFYPCHPNADPEHFSCLFCYCPLYVLGGQCGGNFSYLPNGYKDCSHCLFPHQPENYDKIVSRYKEISSVMQTFSKQTDPNKK